VPLLHHKYSDDVSVFAVETKNMTVGLRLLNGLKKTRSATVSVTDQRLQSNIMQHAAVDHLDSGLEFVTSTKPYSAVPGPRQLPLIGNAWRFLPYIGECGVSYKYHLTSLSLFYSVANNFRAND
jgi:hypothetical protein